MNENTSIENVVENAIETIPMTSMTEMKDKPSIWSIVFILLAVIGLGSSIYFMYKGTMWVLTKFKDGTWSLQKAPQNAQKADTASKAPNAEQKTE